MKIGLISPKSSFFYKDDNKNKILKELPGYKIQNDYYWCGLGSALPILASITDDQFDLEIIDENNENINFDKDYDLVGITAMTHQAIRAYQICAEFRKKKIHTVIGGIHPTVMYEEAKNYADTVVIGEAENIWPILLKDFKLNKIKPVYHHKDYGDVDITKSPIPRYDLLKNYNYNILWINNQRGCPYDCDFCTITSIFGKKVRYKKIEQVKNEIVFIKNDFKHINIGFSDDNMFVNRQLSKDLMIQFAELQFRWVVQSDISIGEEDELLSLIQKAGCLVFFIGLESLNQKNLSQIYSTGKKLKYDYFLKYKDFINNIQKHGIGVFGSFIIGFDNDNEKSINKIVDFIYETNMLTAMINILTPLPGTRLRNRLLSENRILPTSWDNYTFRDINLIVKNINFIDLENSLFEANKNIYSKERVLLTTNYFKEIFKKMNQEL